MTFIALPNHQVVSTIVESGKNLSAEQKKMERCPLLYEWHRKQYVGAAHGLAGIYYMLMQVSLKPHLLLLFSDFSFFLVFYPPYHLIL